MPPKALRERTFTPGKDWLWYAPNGMDAFGEHEIQAVAEVLRKGWLTVGPTAAEFEKRIAKLFGKRHGLFVNSGSSANLLALEMLKFPKGSEIITPACNFNTTVSPIVQTGSVPVLVDVEVGTYVMSPEVLEKALSKKTVAVMVPHLIGNFIDLPAFSAFCKKHKLVLIEDSCDTIGGSFHSKPSGIWTDVTTTSFYASHIITAGGAGGMVMLNEKKLREKARVFRDWGRGISRHDQNIGSRLATYKIDGRQYDSAFVFVERGYNFKPTEMQAAFGLAQLERLQTFIQKRTENFNAIYAFFKRHEEHFILPKSLPNCQVNWLAFPLTVRPGAPFERNTFVRYLENHKIQTRPLFSGNILKHPPYMHIKHRRVGQLPNSQTILERSCVIGVHHGITRQMRSYLFEVVESFLKKYQ